MGRRIRTSRPSPAIVVAVLALVAALAGTAIAGPEASTSAVTKKKVKKLVKKEVAKQIENATGPPGPAGAQGVQGPPGKDATKLFAYIRDAGNTDTATLEYGSGVTAVDDDELPGAGHYTVTFNRSLVNCVVQAQQGLGNPSGTGGASTIGPAHPDVGVGASVGVGNNQALVTFYNGSNVTADTAFMITAFC